MSDKLELPLVVIAICNNTCYVRTCCLSMSFFGIEFPPNPYIHAQTAFMLGVGVFIFLALEHCEFFVCVVEHFMWSGLVRELT